MIGSLRVNAQIIDRYLESKVMRLNASKTLYMLFYIPAELCRATPPVSGGEIRSTQSFKYLGIWFDSVFRLMIIVIS